MRQEQRQRQERQGRQGKGKGDGKTKSKDPKGKSKSPRGASTDPKKVCMRWTKTAQCTDPECKLIHNSVCKLWLADKQNGCKKGKDCTYPHHEKSRKDLVKATPLVVAAGDKPNQGDHANGSKRKVGGIMLQPVSTNTSSRINPTKTSGKGHNHSSGGGQAGGGPRLDESKSNDE